MSIKFNCKINIKHNFKNIEKVISELPKVIEQSAEEVLKNIQGYAIRLEKGHHEDGILVEMIDSSNMEVKGRVYTSKEKLPFAMFEHFGTGEFAEMDHIGITKHFIESGYTEWFIPVNKVLRELNYPIVTINGLQFYIAHSVKSNHFMTDAEFKSREENKEIVIKKINEMLREVAK